MSYIEEKNKAFKAVEQLIALCVLEEDVKKRIFYGKKLTKAMSSIKKYTDCMDKTLNDMITKLTNAANIIVTQDDWLDYLEIAMGDQKEEIIHKASLEREAVENYKKKHKRG